MHLCNYSLMASLNRIINYYKFLINVFWTTEIIESKKSICIILGIIIRQYIPSMLCILFRSYFYPHPLLTCQNVELAV